MKRIDGGRQPPFAWSPAGWPSPGAYRVPGESQVWCYTDRFSYLPGDTVTLHCSSNVAAFRLEIVRDGSDPQCIFRQEGLQAGYFPAPADAYAAGCDWPPCFHWQVPENLSSGFYLVRLILDEPSHETWVYEHFFVVRAPVGQRRDMALLVTTSTLLAYNDWGGANHYRGLGDKVGEDEGSPLSSMHRPLSRGFLSKPADAPRECHSHDPLPNRAPRYQAYEWARDHGFGRHHADAFWASYERDFVVWAERAGFTFDYLTQNDLHSDPGSLDDYLCLCIVGHDEYWSWEMRDVVDRFVNAGGRLARFAGNYQWQVRFSQNMSTQYCYRLPTLDPMTAQQPQRATTVWEARSVGRPGAATMGLNGLGGIYNRYGVATPRSSGGFTVYRPEHWCFEGTDLYYGDLLGGKPVCLAAFEVDSVEYNFHRGLPVPTFEDGAPETLQILALCPAVKGEEDRFDGSVPLGGPEFEMQRYLDALGDDVPQYLLESGMRGAGMMASFTRGMGEVFNGGSTEWPHALAQGDPSVDRIVRNVLYRFGERSRADKEDFSG